MSDLPTLVFVPGAWHRPICYSKIIKPLEEEYNLKCRAVTLPSASDNPEATFKDDLDAACGVISGETGEGRDVVVIAHSYGGLVGNSAIKDFVRGEEGKGRVVGLVLIASGFTFTGLAFMDPLLGIPPPAWRVNRDTGFAEIVVDAGEFFYHDVEEGERGYWVRQLGEQSLKSLFEGGEYTYAGWRDVPAWYVGTVEDRGLPVVVQRMNVGMARGMGGDVVHRELRSGHSPFLSMPGEVVGILVEAVEAFTGKKVARREEVGGTGGGGGVILPAVRLWEPTTWWRFGVPFFFGRIIGRGIVAFGWWRRVWRGLW
ncbi:hypothetical protein TWF481_011341 [Arthrobotrys musiformis]|uniref:AB hydrolase-1 domain-containing protein n=1 Tax=Arthrobotrys musiformis TaxID=47236 RepID=A0AAV9VZH5_9PEZI